MNITKEIIERLGLIGYSLEVSPILQYFLKENLKQIYGDSLTDSNDIDFIIVGNSLEIESIYLDGKLVLSVECDEATCSATIKCDRVVNNEKAKVFEIFILPSYIENRITNEDEIVKKYTYDKSKECFGFEVSTLLNNINKIHYSASLSPLNAKVRNLDWFAYCRKFPPKDKEKSFLKRVVDEISGKGEYRQIATSRDANIDLTEFPESIYESLINDARIVLESTKTENKKRIRI